MCRWVLDGFMLKSGLGIRRQQNGQPRRPSVGNSPNTKPSIAPLTHRSVGRINSRPGQFARVLAQMVRRFRIES